MVEAAASFRLACRAADDELFRLATRPSRTAMFLGMARRLADELPAGGHVVNLCHDRLHFAVALAAAMLRGQVSLLTGDRAPDRLRALAERFTDSIRCPTTRDRRARCVIICSGRSRRGRICR